MWSPSAYLQGCGARAWKIGAVKPRFRKLDRCGPQSRGLDRPTGVDPVTRQLREHLASLLPARYLVLSVGVGLRISELVHEGLPQLPSSALLAHSW
jgi:hypothetical protein